MAAMRGPRAQVGSDSWINDERASAIGIARSEVEEFSFSALNELEWLNEHMTSIFDENEINLVETFKTPGRLRGKTPRTARKLPQAHRAVRSPFLMRRATAMAHFVQPLADIFVSTAVNNANHSNQNASVQSPRSQAHAINRTDSPVKPESTRKNTPPPAAVSRVQDSGYFGSQDCEPVKVHVDLDAADCNRAVKSFPSTYNCAQQLCREPSLPPPPSLEPAGLQSVLETQEAPFGAKTCIKLMEDRTAFLRLGEDKSSINKPTTTARPDWEQPIGAHGAGILRQADLDPPDENRSSSEGSSPMRPVVRKSSLNFASLPAREPLTAGKSLGARASRTSHLEGPISKTSVDLDCLGTLGKSDGTDSKPQDCDDVVSEGLPNGASDDEIESAANHMKSYTNRPQDQTDEVGTSTVCPYQLNPLPVGQSISSKDRAFELHKHKREHAVKSTPGAFPEDDDNWIEPLPGNEGEMAERPQSRNHISGMVEVERTKMSTSSDPLVRSSASLDIHALNKSISAPGHSSIIESENLSRLVLKSPSRSIRESPLRQVKNKLSSILKSSRGLLASSAALSAEGKSMMSPSAHRIGVPSAPLAENLGPQSSVEPPTSPGSPTRSTTRRTRASLERVKEEKRRGKEAKRIEEQEQKLEEARKREGEKARRFGKEQEREPLRGDLKKDDESASNNLSPKPDSSRSPQTKVVTLPKFVSAGVDAEMVMASSDLPPTSQLPSSNRKPQTEEAYRPAKSFKVAPNRVKQAPAHIRVNTGSQHTQYLPAASKACTSSNDRAGPSNHVHQHLGASFSSSTTAKSTPLMQSSNTSSLNGQSKALEAASASRKKDQEVREARRRRDAKAAVERKPPAANEGPRKQEQLRRFEADKARQDRETAAFHAEGKATARRKAVLEKAKMTKAPPPATRNHTAVHQNGTGSLEKPTSNASSAVASHHVPGTVSHKTSAGPAMIEDPARPVHSILVGAVKAGTKRSIDPTRTDDSQAARLPSRNGSVYQMNDCKRRRTSLDNNDKSNSDKLPNIRGQPVRPSITLKREVPSKPVYALANSGQSASRDLFKATVTAQHQGQARAAHPLDMAQISKGIIPFAPSPNLHGSTYKTPARLAAPNGARSVAKSAYRSSPLFQNGESIELPEIQTDDEDDEEEDDNGTVAAWADSPDLRRALMRQETMDPSAIFGPPASLNMEEVFQKSKDRWHKFRARTSSANWSGTDRLTEEEIRKDLAARDKLRREGGWSYEMSKEML